MKSPSKATLNILTQLKSCNTFKVHNIVGEDIECLKRTSKGLRPWFVISIKFQIMKSSSTYYTLQTLQHFISLKKITQTDMYTKLCWISSPGTKTQSATGHHLLTVFFTIILCYSKNSCTLNNHTIFYLCQRDWYFNVNDNIQCGEYLWLNYKLNYKECQHLRNHFCQKWLSYSSQGRTHYIKL